MKVLVESHRQERRCVPIRPERLQLIHFRLVYVASALLLLGAGAVGLTTKLDNIPEG